MSNNIVKTKPPFSLKIEKYINYFAKKYASESWNYEDIKQELYIVVIECKEKYNNKRSSFETFVVRSFKYFFLSHFSKQIKKNYSRNNRIDVALKNLKSEINSEIDFSLYFEDELYQRIFNLKINEDLKLTEISQLLGMQIREIKNIIKRGIESLKKDI